MTKSWPVRLSTALRGGIALQVYELSLKLHRLAIFPPANSGGHVGSTVGAHETSPAVFCRKRPKYSSSHESTDLSFSHPVLCVLVVPEKTRGNQFRAAYHDQLNPPQQHTTIVFYFHDSYLEVRSHLLQELISPFFPYKRTKQSNTTEKTPDKRE